MDMYGGSNRRPVIELKNSFPYGLALTNDYVYWTDWKKYDLRLPAYHVSFLVNVVVTVF